MKREIKEYITRIINTIYLKVGIHPENTSPGIIMYGREDHLDIVAICANTINLLHKFNTVKLPFKVEYELNKLQYTHPLRDTLSDKFWSGLRDLYPDLQKIEKLYYECKGIPQEILDL